MEIVNSAVEGQVSEVFLQGMVNRMATSFYKYGHVKENFPEPMDAVAMIQDRLRMYLETGNTEWLMDVANYAMIEFMHPRSEGAYFKATSSDESPGRIMRSGRRTDVGMEAK